MMDFTRLCPTRRSTLRALAGVAASAAATACGGAQHPGTLYVAQVGDVGSADGHLNSGFDSFWLAYDRLTAYDETLTPHAQLAESWEIDRSFRRIVLHLRRGVRFHSGRDFTSADVRYNLMRVREPSVGAGSIGRVSAWFAIDTPDDHTVVLTSERPRPSVFDFFEYFNIVDREAMEGPNARSSAVGTGPFMLAEWRPGDLIRMVKNPDYWQVGRPLLDEIIIRISPDPLSMLAQLESGAVDAINRVQARDSAHLRGQTGFVVIENPDPPIYMMTINTTLPPFDNKLVRQALNYAIDRRRFTRTVLLDTAQPMALPWPEHSPAFDPIKNRAYDFDLDRARALLSQAGVANLELDMIWINAYNELRGFAEIFQGDLAKIGVRARLRPLEAGLWRAEQLTQRYRGINLTFAGPTHLDPITVTALRNFAPEGNAAGFRSAEYTALADRLSSETEPERQRVLYARLNDLYLDECFFIPISGRPTSLVTRARVSGVRYSLHEAVVYTDARLS